MGSKLWGYAALFAGLALAVVSGGASLGLVAKATATAIVPWLMGATLALSLVSGNVAARDQRKAANAALEDRVTTIRSTDEPRAILYGRQRVGGVLTYVSPPFGARKESVTLVITLVGHPCDAVEQIWIDDEPVTLDANGVVTGGVNTGKWATRITDLSTVTGTGPAVWDAGSPSSNRIAAPLGATGVVSVMYQVAAGDVFQYAVNGVDYVVIPNSFDIGVLNGAMTGASISITYKGYWLLNGSIKVRTWTGFETGSARRDTDLETNSGGAWASTATGDGICRMHVTMAYNETLFADGVPQFSAVVRGRRIYDPRLDSTNGGTGSHRYSDPTTWAWSRNAALAARDYLTWSWGLGIAHTRVDDALVIAAANACETQIRIHPTDAGFTDYQFTVDGFLSTSQSPPDNLDELCAAMAGFAAPSGDKWRIMAGAWTAPAADATLRDEHVVGDAEFTAFMDAGELMNCVNGRYRDQTTYQITDWPGYKSSTYITADGGQEAWKALDWPLTINEFRAQRLGKLHLHRARQSLVYSATFTTAAWRFQPGDRLRLLLTEYGWDTVSQDSGTGKVFRVLDRQWVFPDQVRLVLQEDTAAVYSWAFDEAIAGDPTPNTTLPSASTVAAPINLEGSASTADFFVAPDGTQVGYVRFTWDAITDSGVLAGGWLELRWKRAAEPTFRIERISPFAVEYRLTETVRATELLNVGILAVNASQARSDLTLIEGNVSPGLVNGLFSVETAFVTGSGGTVWSGNHALNADYRHGISGWSLFLLASPSYTVQATQAGMSPTVRLTGPPSWNVMVEEQGAGAVASSALVAGWSQAKPITAVPGERYGVRALVELDGCDAVVAIAFYRADGSFIAGSLTYGAVLTKVYTGASSKASYIAGTAYGTAPAGSAGVRGIVYKYGTKAPASTSRMWVLEPDVRELVGADAMPGWAVGASGPQSRTIVQPYSESGTTVSTTGTVYVDHVLGSFVAEASGTIDIRVVCEVVAKAASGYTNVVSLGIYQTSKRALISRQVLSVTGGTDVPQSASIEASMTCVAGELISPLLRLSRTHYGVGANYNATDKVRKVECTFNVVYD